MLTLAALLVAASAAIVATFGPVHVLYTFRGRLLFPRDDALRARMHEVAPVITRETTMWKTWIGFNASHGLGLVLFGATYGYLALARGALLFGSTFLLALGLAALCCWCVLAKRYFFSVPLRGIVVAMVLYAAGMIASGIAGARSVSREGTPQPPAVEAPGVREGR